MFLLPELFQEPHIVFKQKPDVVCTVGFEGAGSGVGGIAHFFGSLFDPLAGFLADVLLMVQGFADRGNGHAAA